MKSVIRPASRLLDRSIDGWARLTLLGAAGLLVVTYFVPLWNLTMFAPQYPDGLRLDIYSYTLVGGNGGQDITEINVLNHYIGMRDLNTAAFAEFQWMPFAIGILGLLVLRTVVHATMAALLDVTMLFGYFAAFSAWSLGYKLYRYGHDLAPDAAIKVQPFMPPMFGYRQIANFEVYSYPRLGTYAMAGAVLLLVVALTWTWWRSRQAEPVTGAAGA
jgi:copper chaperone NosL